MRSTDFPFAVTPQRLQRGGEFSVDYSAPSAALAAVRANDGQQFGGISARDVSVRDQIKDKLAGIVGRRNADKLMGVGELLGADAPLMLDEARLAYREGRPGEAAATAALAALPLPGAVKKGIKTAAKGAAKATKAAEKSLAVKPTQRAAAQPKPASVKDIRPSTDDVYKVMEANTTAGRVIGDKMMPISKLTGGVTAAADDARRVDQLVEAMSSPEGYVSRLIVDDAGNVIEGQHRLEALRRMGVSEVPVTQYVDLERAVPFSVMRDAAAAQNIHPDQANQIAKQLAEIYADEGGNMAEVLQYSAPKGFEKAWEAAINAMPFAAKKTAPPKAARTKYQAVEPVATPHPELADVQFPQGAGLGGSFAIINRVPIVGRRPFMAQSSKGYSGLAGSVPANRVTADIQNVVNMRPEVVISPEEIAKKYGSGIPLIGDKLIAGTALRRVNDRAQVGETLSMGGPGYSRIAEALGGLEAWKSSPAVIGGLETMRKSGEDLYRKPVAGIYTTMGATGLDQSTSMMDLLGRQLAAGGVREADLLDFDTAVKGILGKDAAENFIGFAKDPMAAAAQLNDISKVRMPQRTAIQKLLDQASALEKGFPDIGSNRVALSVPELLYAPEGTSGRAIMGLTPSGTASGRNSVPVVHPNYPATLSGFYEGRTEFGVPRELMFSSYYNAMQKLADKGYTPTQIQAYLFQRTPVEAKEAFGSDPRIQQFDQEWVDNMSKYIEDIRKYGEEPYAQGGLAVRRRQAPFAVRQSPRPRKSRKA
jgi:hypothetical protein